MSPWDPLSKGTNVPPISILLKDYLHSSYINIISLQSAFFEITAMGEKQTNPPHPKKSNQPNKTPQKPKKKPPQTHKPNSTTKTREKEIH